MSINLQAPPSEKKHGKFYGVGVGPGDPELLTLKALNLLKAVPVVFVPVSRMGKDSYALGIVEKYLDFSKQERIDLLFPMKTNQEELVPHWEKAVERILDVLRNGLDAAFITEGDPLFYSTFIYLFTRLKNKVPTENLKIIPGVASFCASASAAKFPVVFGDARLAVLPTIHDPDCIEEILENFDSVVFMKINKVLTPLMEKLEKLGLSEKFVYVGRCGTTSERIVRNAEEMRQVNPDYLSLLIVRK